MWVIRHSERLDEANEHAWKALINSTYARSTRVHETASMPSVGTSRRPNFSQPSRPIQSEHSVSSQRISKNAQPKAPAICDSRQSVQDQASFLHDPPLSPHNGLRFANQMALSLQKLLKDSTNGLSPFPLVLLFTSKLRRAVETAVAIARVLAIPVFLSSGLSRVISAVRKSPSFQFVSLTALQAQFPDVTFVDADAFLPVESWRSSVKAIGQYTRSPNMLPALTFDQPTSADAVSVVVGHRETIRGLVGSKIQTPYCCMAHFQAAPATSTPAGDISEDCVHFVASFDMNGVPLNS